MFTGDKIRSIRVYWDQATVLKQLQIVGARGRGWPITDGNSQIELVTKTGKSNYQSSLMQQLFQSRNQRLDKVRFLNTLLTLDQPIQNGKPAVATVSVTSPETPKPKGTATTTPRRTYSITDDIEEEVKESLRLPRAGWQNHRQHFTLSEEGDVPLKEQSPVRLPRVGKAPRREFSFSNLSEAYKSQETTASKPREPTHFELDGDTEEGNAPVKPSQGSGTSEVPTKVFAPIAEESPAPNPAVRPHRALQHEIIFHDADSSPRDPLKPSIGGGTGGRRPEETIFFELAEDANPFVQPKKTHITRRDQKTHFTFNDESPPATPNPRAKAMPLQHFIEGTPDPHEAEYRARALQRKEVNHFRPDTMPHFEFIDHSDNDDAHQPKKENSEGMNKLLKGIGRNWIMGSDSPVASKETHRSGLPKKGLSPHFSIGDSSPKKSEEEKENGQTNHGQTKR